MSVLVTGHMRSGTSMTAGLLEAHGVFFGETDGPSDNNRKGSVESKWLKRALQADRLPKDWSECWERRLKAEGWDGETPWGAKAVAVHWAELRSLHPDVVVLCYRPKEDILASCKRYGGGMRYSRAYREPMVAAHWAIMESIRLDYPGTVVSVNTPDLVAGTYTDILPAFDALGIEFDEGIAAEWIDPGLFHGP